MRGRIKHVIAWGYRVFILNMTLGGFGTFLIVYELVADLVGIRAAGLDKAGTFLGAMLTFVGVGITSISVFFYNIKVTRPDPISYPVAILVILGCCLCIGFLIVRGDVPGNVVNGFALLGIAGGLLRIQPNPQIGANEF